MKQVCQKTVVELSVGWMTIKTEGKNTSDFKIKQVCLQLALLRFLHPCFPLKKLKLQTEGTLAAQHGDAVVQGRDPHC